MKVCLIEPPKYVSLSNFVSTIAMPPLGLAYLTATVEKMGFKPTVIDACGLGLDQYYQFRDVRVRGLKNTEIIEKIPADVEFIGVSCMFTALWPLVRVLLQEIHAAFPNAFLVLGGEHGTGAPEFSLKQAPFLDAVVMGEGEETLEALLQSLKNNVSYKDIAGIAYPTDTGVQINPRRERIRDVDSIPTPAWEQFPIEKYQLLGQPHGASQGKFMPMLATRGCPFQCTFCTSAKMWTTRWIARNPKLVVDEMEYYMRRYNATDFQFEDLTAIVKPKWAIEFCDEILNRNLQVTFQLPSGTRSEAITYELAVKLKAAGCHDFAFAPESGDTRVLKAIKKKVDLNKMFNSARQAIKAGISVGCFFIIGFPEDNWRSILNTYKAIIKCAFIGFANVNVNAYSPQPNTESYNDLVAHGIIPGDYNDDYLTSLFTFQDIGRLKTSYNSKFSDRKLTFLVGFGLFLFYFFYFAFRPQRIWMLIKDLKSDVSTNKTNKGLKAMLGDWGRIRGN